jgi:hypothetical protein
MVNIATRPIANSIGVVKRSLPPHIVASQLKIFTPVGMAMSIVASEKTSRRSGPCPTRTCGAPTRRTQEADRDARETIDG